ncbi:MAG: N-formylglutamate amidohydrolase [Candidatus Obscuribacterales bacterium]|nr:N-formylglutamate amidohydrolase [Candidatus Obscuribacterales bacterium]
MKLPLLISVPHGGLSIPEELQPFLKIGPELIEKASDQGSFEIYSGLEGRVERYLFADIARVLVDVNRAADNRKPDGVIKTRTSGKLVYDPYPDAETIETVIARYHAPYHRELARLSRIDGVRLGVDCHTMFELAPDDAPDPKGSPRPMICLSDGAGTTLPAGWMDRLTVIFRKEFEGFDVGVNKPFNGGHIIRSHSLNLPWLQIEISRLSLLSSEAKGARVLAALTQFCEETFETRPAPAACRLIAWFRRLLTKAA